MPVLQFGYASDLVLGQANTKQYRPGRTSGKDDMPWMSMHEDQRHLRIYASMNDFYVSLVFRIFVWNKLPGDLPDKLESLESADSRQTRALIPLSQIPHR